MLDHENPRLRDHTKIRPDCYLIDWRRGPSWAHHWEAPDNQITVAVVRPRYERANLPDPPGWFAFFAPDGAPLYVEEFEALWLRGFRAGCCQMTPREWCESRARELEDSVVTWEIEWCAAQSEFADDRGDPYPWFWALDHFFGDILDELAGWQDDEEDEEDEEQDAGEEASG